MYPSMSEAMMDIKEMNGQPAADMHNPFEGQGGAWSDTQRVQAQGESQPSLECLTEWDLLLTTEGTSSETEHMYSANTFECHNMI